VFYPVQLTANEKDKRRQRLLKLLRVHHTDGSQGLWEQAREGKLSVSFAHWHSIFWSVIDIHLGPSSKVSLLFMKI
jgi:hypothetical protein